MDIRSTSPYVASSAPSAPSAPTASGASMAASTPIAAAVKQATPDSSPDQVAQALKDINGALKVRSPNLEFSIDKDSARTVVTVTDTSTNEVIRQMPTKEALEISKALEHLQSLLIKHSA